jgi:hypothetical protein
LEAIFSGLPAVSEPRGIEESPEKRVMFYRFKGFNRHKMLRGFNPAFKGGAAEIGPDIVQ